MEIDKSAPDEAKTMRFGRAGEVAELFQAAGLIDIEETTITVSAHVGTPSTTVETAGAEDYEIRIDITGRQLLTIVTGATLQPHPDPREGGRLSAWGEIDHWLGGAAVAYALTLTARDRRALCAAIVTACRTTEDTEIEISVNQLEAGDRVEAGDGDEADAGRIDLIHGTDAWVSWDSGVRTLAALSDLRPERK